MVLMETRAETEPLTAPKGNNHPPTHPRVITQNEGGITGLLIPIWGGLFLTQTMKTDKGRSNYSCYFL